MCFVKRLIVFHFVVQLWPSASLFADGFWAGSASPIVHGRPRVPHSTTALTADGDGNAASPAQPDDEIDAPALLSQAYQMLTVKELRELLQHKGALLSGSKQELVDRLEGILVSGKEKSQSTASRNATQSTKPSTDEKRKLLESYNHMTLKELKSALRERGVKVSGNKRELVQRLTISRYESGSQSLPDRSNSRSESLAEDATEGWSILELSATLTRESNATTEVTDLHDVELPCLSGLMFVNKPSGWSTLPTKQQQENPASPAFPCLSDSVINWLYNHPEGKERLRRAERDQEHWWHWTLQALAQHPQQRKKWEKIKDKQSKKRATFAPRPAHRLDIDTSGIVCIALTPHALRATNALFERKSRGSLADAPPRTRRSGGGAADIGVHKSYVALVEGTLGAAPGPAAGVVTHAIGKVWIDDHNEWACDAAGDGSTAFLRPAQAGAATFVPGSLREAVTAWTAVAAEPSAGAGAVTRVALAPRTGRGHQLRLHLAALGHPCVGDEMHGTAVGAGRDAGRVREGRLCLHASALSVHAWCASPNDARDAFRMCRVDVESCPPF